MTGQASILIHARGRQTADECAFWNRLSGDLRRLGAALKVVAHHPPASGVEFEMAVIENGLDFAPEHRDSEPAYGGWTRDDLLDREAFWRGSAGDRGRRLRAGGLGYYADRYGGWLEAWRPSLVVIWNGQHAQELVLEGLCRERAIPLAWVERGPLAGTLHFDTRGVLGGSWAADASVRWANDEEQRRWSEVFASLRERAVRRTWWEQPGACTRDVHARLGIPDGARVIGFAGQVDRDAQNLLYSPSFDRNLDAFSWLLHAAASSEAWFISGKHHPRSDTPAEAYAELCEGRPAAWTSDVPVGAWLGVCDRFAAVNSATLFEAMLRGIPSLALGRGVFSGKGAFYEVDDPACSAETVSAWLAGAGAEERSTRFADLCAWLLSDHLIATDPRDEALGLHGTRTLAERLLAWSCVPAEGVPS